jgi:hypothetical protein
VVVPGCVVLCKEPQKLGTLTSIRSSEVAAQPRAFTCCIMTSIISLASTVGLLKVNWEDDVQRMSRESVASKRR